MAPTIGPKEDGNMNNTFFAIRDFLGNVYKFLFDPSRSDVVVSERENNIRFSRHAIRNFMHTKDNKSNQSNQPTL